VNAVKPTTSGILILSLTTACACRCAFCGLPDSRPHTVLPRDVLIAALDGPPAGTSWQEVNLTGGDPLVIPAARALFPEILARRHRFARLSVSSAGIPAERALAGLRALAGQVPIDLYVSLDGVGDLHGRIRGRRDAFEQVDRFLLAARDLDGVRVAFSCVVNRLNADHLDEVADHATARRLPISYALVNSSDHYINSEPLYGDVALTAAQVPLVADFLKRRSGQRLDEDLQRVLRGGRRDLPCRLLRNGVLVTSDGTVAICGTSRRMTLGRLLPGQPATLAWHELLARRPALLASGVSAVCGTCTTNCYAWRKSDEPVPA